MDSNGFSDPFVVVVHNDNKKMSKTTEIIYKSLNPVWKDADYSFRVVSTLTDSLKLVCWDCKCLSSSFFALLLLTTCGRRQDWPQRL